MPNIIHWLLFKVISFAFEMIMIIESLVNDFIRHVYVPFFISSNNPKKIITDISTFAKKPHHQVTLAVQVKMSKRADLNRTILKVVRYSKIIEESISPNNFNCFLTSQDLSKEEMEEFKVNLNELIPKGSKLKLILQDEIDYTQKLKMQKSKSTPLVISFSNYPSVCGLPASFLIGAEICFNPPILKTVDYDIFTAFQRYSTSEQRKGK